MMEAAGGDNHLDGPDEVNFSENASGESSPFLVLGPRRTISQLPNLTLLSLRDPISAKRVPVSGSRASILALCIPAAPVHSFGTSINTLSTSCTISRMPV